MVSASTMSISGEQSPPAWYVHAPPPEQLNRLFSTGVNAGGCLIKDQVCGVSTSTRASASSCFCPTEDYSPALPAAYKYHHSCCAPARQLHGFQRLPDAFFGDITSRVTLARKVSASTTGSCCTIARPDAARCDLTNLMDDHQGESTFR